MKVDGGNGKFFTRDHPHEIISPHVMTFEVIRFWLRELSTNPEYGWHGGGVLGLERSLGMTPQSMRRKLTVGWIWPKEQVRLTARINDILNGYIVPKRFGNRVDGVWTDPPMPPVASAKPRVLNLKVGVRGFVVVTAQTKKPLAMPEFRDAFRNVSFWDPDSKKSRL